MSEEQKLHGADKNAAPQDRQMSSDLVASMKAREAELLRIIERSRVGYEEKLADAVRKMQESHAATLKQKDALIDELKSSMAAKDQYIIKLQTDLQEHARSTEDQLRAQKREFQVKEGEMKARVGQVLNDKEKIRFECECAKSVVDTHKLGLTLLQQRVATAEQNWRASRLVDLLSVESAARELQHNQNDALFDAVRLAFSLLQAMETRLKSEHEDHIQHTRKVVREAVARTGYVSAMDVDPASSSSPSLGEEIVTLIQLIVQRADLERDTASERNSRERHERHHLINQIENQEAAQRQQTDAQDQALHKLDHRVKSIDRAIELLRVRVNVTVPQRAASRATNDVVESLVKEHEGQIAGLAQHCRQLEDDVRYFKGVNQHDVAEQWKEKAEKAISERGLLEETSRLSAAKATTLAANLRDSESNVRELAASNKRLVAQLAAWSENEGRECERLRAMAEELQSNLSSASRTLEATTCERDAARQAVGDLREELSRTKNSLAKLRQKFLELPVPTEHALRKTHPPHEAHDGPARFSASATVSNLLERTIEPAEYEALEAQVFRLRKERDSLKLQLDGALAEIGHSEGNRAETMDRYMALLSSIDAAPRVHQELQWKLNEVEQIKKKLGQQEVELQERNVELNKREAKISRTVAKYQSRGVDLLEKLMTRSTLSASASVADEIQSKSAARPMSGASYASVGRADFPTPISDVSSPAMALEFDPTIPVTVEIPEERPGDTARSLTMHGRKASFGVAPRREVPAGQRLLPMHARPAVQLPPSSQIDSPQRLRHA